MVLRLIVIRQKIKGKIYGYFMKKTGEDFQIGSNVYISGMNYIILGKNIHLHNNCQLIGGGGIIIEDNVLFSPGVKIYSTTHQYKDRKKDIMFQPFIHKKVRIGKGSWLCADTIILPGVTIGKHCVIASGSVVRNNIPDYTLAGGTPAKIIKKI